jgi:hypothetical protein
MKNKTDCKIVRFGDWAHQAMVEAEGLCQGNFGSVTITEVNAVCEDDRTEETLPCFETTVGYAIQLRQYLLDTGKPYDFQIVVQRTRSKNTWRLAEKSEWVPAKKRTMNKRRIVKKCLSRLGFGSNL